MDDRILEELAELMTLLELAEEIVKKERASKMTAS